MKSTKGENLIQLNFSFKIPLIIFGRNELTQNLSNVHKNDFFLYELSVKIVVTDTWIWYTVNINFNHIFYHFIYKYCCIKYDWLWTLPIANIQLTFFILPSLPKDKNVQYDSFVFSFKAINTVSNNKKLYIQKRLF